MLKELKELLLIIFKQDNDSLETIKISMGEETAKQYPIPPVKLVDSTIEEIGLAPRVEVVDVGILDDEETYNRVKFPKYSNWIMFKISDVKIKRRKIFRLGDYYVKLFHSGLNKWNFVFFTKSRMMMGPDRNNNYTFTDYYYPAQHPHIYNGRPCLGGFDTPLRAALTNYNLVGFLWNIKLYLNNWNYRSPHHNPETFEYRNCTMIKKKHFIPVLLDELCIGKYMETANLNDSNDIYSYETKSLTSARCKEYETEPLCRIIKEESYWDGDNFLHKMDKIFSYNTERYIRIKYIENNIQFEHQHDYFIFVRTLYSMIWDIARSQLLINTYDWTNDDNYKIKDIKIFSHSLSYYGNKVYEEDNGPYNDSYLYYLKSDKEQPESIREGCKRIQYLINSLEDIKCSCNSDEPAAYKVKYQTYKLFGELFSNPDCFKNKENIFNIISDIENNSTPKNNDIKQKIDDLYSEFVVLESILKPAMNNWIINYHEKELRRLTNGKTDINIENLNL